MNNMIKKEKEISGVDINSFGLDSMDNVGISGGVGSADSEIIGDIDDINENKYTGYDRGFTLIEILVVIGIIAVLSAVVLVAINPARQFKLARDSQRVANITAILNAVGQNIAEHKGVFECGVAIPSVSTLITSIGTGVDLAPCLVPTYISSLPFDPGRIGARFTSVSDYNTEYSISQDADGRVKVSAIGEITDDISMTR